MQLFSEKFGVEFAEAYASLLLTLDSSIFVRKQIPILNSFLESECKEVRITFARILIELAQDSLPPLDFSTIIHYISKLTNDSLSSVREVTPALIVAYIKQISDRQTRAQISAYFCFFYNDISPIVRKAAVEALVPLSEVLDDSEKYILILYLSKHFLQDSDREVKKLLYQKLGRIISSLGSLTDSSMIVQYSNLLLSSDSEISYAAAFSFPAVALALGQNRWPELTVSFHSVIKSPSEKIRRTLSFGLGSFAYLINIYECQKVAIFFLNDIPSVAIGIISNLNQIIRFVSDPNALRFCLEVSYISKCTDWRTRLQISTQLRYCSEDFDHDILFKSASFLIHDQNATVRKDAVLSYAYLLTPDKMNEVEELGKSSDHWNRSIVAQLFSYGEDDCLLPHVDILQNLCQDPVVNVRIAAANSALSISERSQIAQQKLQNVLNTLAQEEDLDIQNVFQSV